MANNTKEIKGLISSIPETDYYKLLVKAATKDKSFCDFLMLTYSFNGFSEIDIFNETKKDLSSIVSKRYVGYNNIDKVASFIPLLSKRINEFTKISKNKKLEADLMLYALDLAIDPYFFNDCFTQYENKLSLFAAKLIDLVLNDLHEDYLADYRDPINKLLQELHTSYFIQNTDRLPTKILT